MMAMMMAIIDDDGSDGRFLSAMISGGAGLFFFLVGRVGYILLFLSLLSFFLSGTLTHSFFPPDSYFIVVHTFYLS